MKKLVNCICIVIFVCLCFASLTACSLNEDNIGLPKEVNGVSFSGYDSGRVSTSIEYQSGYLINYWIMGDFYAIQYFVERDIFSKDEVCVAVVHKSALSFYIREISPTTQSKMEKVIKYDKDQILEKLGLSLSGEYISTGNYYTQSAEFARFINIERDINDNKNNNGGLNTGNLVVA